MLQSSYSNKCYQIFSSQESPEEYQRHYGLSRFRNDLQDESVTKSEPNVFLFAMRRGQ